MKVKIYTLGRFSLVSNGKPVKFTKKAQSKPLLMLKALIALGGREVRKEQIADTLWPDADGDISAKSFDTTLYRLRKMIGVPKAILLHNSCLTLNPDLCWVDVWEFQRLCNQADAAWNGARRFDTMDAIQLTLQAVEIYKGPFLAEEMDEAWTLALRERLRNKFLREIGKLGRNYEKSGNFEKAVDCFQRGLEVDIFDEESYRRLMACYYRLGNRSKALSVYKRCKNILSVSLGLEPSRETEILRRSILISKD